MFFNRFDYELDSYNEDQYNDNHYDEDVPNVGGHMKQKFTNNIIHFTDWFSYLLSWYFFFCFAYILNKVGQPNTKSSHLVL